MAFQMISDLKAPIYGGMEVAMNEKLLTLISSRKFWAALIGLVMIIVKAYNPNFPITEDQINAAVAILISYIVGTAIVDHGQAFNNLGQ